MDKFKQIVKNEKVDQSVGVHDDDLAMFEY